jgi:lipopolysaccharide biosynthesis glycosyltransferase
MPNAFISLLLDHDTEAALTGNRKNILDQVNELKSIKIDNRFNKKSCSRWLKTSMRQHIAGDFLYLDSDTIITDDLSPLDALEINLGAVLNEHTYLSSLAAYNPVYLNEMQTLDKKLKFTSTFNSNAYFNGGLLLSKDCEKGHAFFNEWHRLWLHCFDKGSVTDQQSYNQANYNLGNVINELDGKWNCQIMSDGGIKYLHEAKIIHYFADRKEKNAFLLANDEILAGIKETGIISSEIIELLANPKALFVANARLKVMDKEIRKFHRSSTYAMTEIIFNTKLGAVIESILTFLRKKIIKPLFVKFSNSK